MTDREKIHELIWALQIIAYKLGIRRDFCPLGNALELEPFIRLTLKNVGEDLYKSLPVSGVRKPPERLNAKQ